MVRHTPHRHRPQPLVRDAFHRLCRMARTVEFTIRPDRRAPDRRDDMIEGSTGRGNTEHGRWRPVTPISAMVVGRLVLGVPGVIGLTVIVLAWSAMTGAGLGIGRALLFSLVAVTVREVIDASAHRLIMRAWRSRDAHGLLLTLVAVVCPALAGFLATRLVDDGADGSHVAAVHGLRRHGREAVGHVARLRRRPGAHPPAPTDPAGVRHRRLPRRPQVPPRAQTGRTGSHSAVAAEAPPQTESAPGEQHVLTTSTDINCDDDHSLVRVRVRHPWAAKR